MKTYFGTLLMAALTALLLAACGDSGAPESAPDVEQSDDARSGGGTPPSEPPPAAASAASAKRACPPQVTSGARPEGAPVDDIVGIRPGMALEDVQRVLECRDDVPLIEVAEKWNIQQTHGFPIRQLIRASDGTACSGQEIARDMGSYGTTPKCNDGGYRFKPVKDITQEFEVVFTGMPGAEKAGAVWRRSQFPEGGNPAIDTLIASLNDKYGAPHASEKDRQGRTMLTWQYDLLGRPMSQSTNNFDQCRRSVNPAFQSSHSWSAACGLTISVQIAPVYGNELLAREMLMGVMHQKNFYDEGKQFEQDLLAANELRKKQEAGEAAAKAVTPDI